jgi:hypothetical protein
MMVASKIYRGIEFVQVSELPGAQKEAVVQTINKDLFIKILVDGKILNDCIQFKDYTVWYNSVFTPKLQPSTNKASETQPVSFDTKQLVFK